MPITQKHSPLDSALHTDSGKRPYQKPAFSSEAIFETMALACGKISITQNACRQQRKVS